MFFRVYAVVVQDGSAPVCLISSTQGEVEKLALSLLMLGILANYHNAALALDELALFAHGLNRGSDFHL